MAEGCLICGKQVEDVIDLMKHIDDEHPEVIKKAIEKFEGKK